MIIYTLEHYLKHVHITKDVQKDIDEIKDELQFYVNNLLKNNRNAQNCEHDKNNNNNNDKYPENTQSHPIVNHTQNDNFNVTNGV